MIAPLPRAAGGELMDLPDQDPRQLERSLADLRGVNRWLGGTRVVLGHLLPMMRRVGRPCRVLDVATGSADIPVAIARAARRQGLRVSVVATDNHATTLAAARRAVAADPEVSVARADALALPFADDEFDFALCSTALHHFDDRDDAVQVLRELGRVASRGVVVNDLARSRVALAGARLLAATVWRAHPVTRHDGPLSVRRAFTARELGELAREAGLEGARVHSHVPFRIALVVDRTRGGEGG